MCRMLIVSSVCLMLPFDVSQESVRDRRSERRWTEAKSTNGGPEFEEDNNLPVLSHPRVSSLPVVKLEALTSSSASAHLV